MLSTSNAMVAPVNVLTKICIDRHPSCHPLQGGMNLCGRRAAPSHPTRPSYRGRHLGRDPPHRKTEQHFVQQRERSAADGLPNFGWLPKPSQCAVFPFPVERLLRRPRLSRRAVTVKAPPSTAQPLCGRRRGGLSRRAVTARVGPAVDSPATVWSTAGVPFPSSGYREGPAVDSAATVWSTGGRRATMMLAVSNRTWSCVVLTG